FGDSVARANSEMETLAGRLGALEQRLTGLERLSTLFQNLDEQAARLEQSQRKTEARITHATEDAERIRSLFEELNRKVDAAEELKEQIGGFLELETPFRELRDEADDLRRRVDGTGELLARLQDHLERVMDTHQAATARTDAFERRHEELTRALQDKERRVAAIEQSLRGL